MSKTQFITTEQRRAQRNVIAVPVIIVDEKGNEWITKTVDISKVGISFVAPEGFLAFGSSLLQVKILNPVSDDICMAGLVEVRGRRIVGSNHIYGVEIIRLYTSDNVFHDISTTGWSPTFDRPPSSQTQNTPPAKKNPAKRVKRRKAGRTSAAKASYAEEEQGSKIRNMILSQVEMSLFDIKGATKEIAQGDQELAQQLYHQISQRLEGIKDLIRHVRIENESELSVICEQAEQLFTETSDEDLYKHLRNGHSTDEALMHIVCDSEISDDAELSTIRRKIANKDEEP